MLRIHLPVKGPSVHQETDQANEGLQILPINLGIDAATATSDFSFRDIRRRPHTIYLVVESEMIRPLAPLIRLFFSDLIASLQTKEPEADEPCPVMIMLDEFDRLGKTPIVAESIKTLRSYGGNLAIVTQTIPALDEIYGENTRRSLQGGAGVKLYLTPSEQKTIEELSQGRRQNHQVRRDPVSLRGTQPVRGAQRF